LISHEFPLDELGKALEILELPGGDSLKVILRH